jgi:hypothetical protein
LTGGGALATLVASGGGGMARPGNPVAEAIDGAVGDWSMSGDAMRWSPELAEGRPAAGSIGGVDGLGGLAGLDAAAGFGSTLGLDMGGVRRLVSGALSSLGTVAGDVVQELRELTRGTPEA